MARPINLTCEYRSEYLGLDTRHPRFSWWIEDERPGAAQSAYRIQVAQVEAAANEPSGASFEAKSIVWDSGEVRSDNTVLLGYAGSALASRTRYCARVAICDQKAAWSAWSDPCVFETAFLDPAEWSASWIGPSDEEAWLDTPAHRQAPAPHLRRGFSLTAPVMSARLYIAARGLAAASINGREVSDDVLIPGWTDFGERAQYLTYDVTDLLSEGDNAIGVVLGDGWYCGRIARVNDGRRLYGARPQLLCELHIQHDDGSESLIASDERWSWSGGAIVASDLYDGEQYDARLEHAGWDTASGGGDWQQVRVVGSATGGYDGSGSTLLDAKVVPPVRRIQEITPIAQSEVEPGKHIFDVGQNIVGWARIRLTGTAGQQITLRFAEMLNADGTLYTENLRSAKATDTYTCARDGEFVWEPRFTFHGFRYIELSGASHAPAADRVTGIVAHNALSRTGEFECSHELVNRLHSNIQWGQRGNYLEAPTDCPQRDERLGWTGDAQVFLPTATFGMNVAPFFVKWQRDLLDAQFPNGVIPMVAPIARYIDSVEENDGGPAWSDAVVICPWTIHERYGDRRIIETHFASMQRFVHSMLERSRALIRSDEFLVPSGGFGDWVSMDAPEGSPIGATPKDLIGTAYFAHSVKLLGRMAQLLGKDREVVRLRDLHRRILEAFRGEYVTPAGRVLGDTQTAYAVALAFDLLPESLRQAAVDRLVAQLERRGWKLDTGFVGTPLLCPVLTRFGRVDIAYKLLLQEEFPSWLYTVNQGATTMWERWNSYTIEHGFGPVGMNSFNHYAYGSIGDWIYGTVAGLRVDMSEPGEPPIRIAPKPGFGIDSARAVLATPFGEATSSWETVDRVVRLSVTIPANASARVEIDAGLAEIHVGDENERAEEGPQIEELVIQEDANDSVFRFRVASGRYSFTWHLRDESGR